MRHNRFVCCGWCFHTPENSAFPTGNSEFQSTLRLCGGFGSTVKRLKQSFSSLLYVFCCIIIAHCVSLLLQGLGGEAGLEIILIIRDGL